MDRPSPVEHQPPPTPWGRTWRLLAVLVISAIVWLPIAGDQARWLLWLDLALGAVSLVVVHHRRRWPLPIALVISAFAAVSGTAAGPATLATVSVATGRRWQQLVVVFVVGLAGAQVFTLTQPGGGEEPLWLLSFLNVIVLAACVGWGMYLGSRRELVSTLRQRAERAEAEQELRIDRARATERARIAREMHDVLAHRISQISLHAGALGFREDLTAEEMRASAAVIRDKAHEALTDLRGVLGVLRDEDTGAVVHAPQPTYDDVPRLVAEATAAGLNVDYVDRVDRSAGPVPEVVGRTVYRIVQEGITNARKHAPGAHLLVELTGSPDDGLDVRLRNPLGFGVGVTPGAGLGLVGLSERAELRGGRLEHRRDAGMFVLHGWLPWAA
ncbi:histidine kinase [Nocardioides sp. zg-579]|uniref:histidine kinase n=1 Tax=Nocardioides marmotae TaxID=2663857 RepID=A0A6I3JFP7_9ACTN|nr:histidine kinase [Nocardioides marmotae]MCR6033294.1 histidine kinase [Gordonia jinghuaiqii]MTB96951.1 histidine kinase [Nocardioides marmotae]QKE00667.1 histidine kinase [Nocardioides marmotae]